MGFSDKQVNALRRNLNGSYVRTREIQGRELSYIEGWHAIAEANRIFGFGGWDRETVESKCVLGRENRGTFQAVYVAKVRITVRAAGETTIREGHGTGEAQGASAGDAHEKALKTAETDATKRALATFGKPFGLSLYLSGRKERDHRSAQSPSGVAPIPDHERRRTLQRLGPSGRYYVPPRAKTVIDPALAREPLPGSGPEPVQVQAPPGGPEASEVPDGASNSTESSSSVEITTSSPPLQPPPGVEVSEPRPGNPGLMIEWPKRHRNPAHLRFVMAQPCLLCGRTPSDAHHLRFAQPRALGRKVSDEFTVPLCRTHHRRLHQSGKEVEWWLAMDRDVDPLEIAKSLWEQSRKTGPSSETTTPPEVPARDLPVK